MSINIVGILLPNGVVLHVQMVLRRCESLIWHASLFNYARQCLILKLVWITRSMLEIVYYEVSLSREKCNPKMISRLGLQVHKANKVRAFIKKGTNEEEKEKQI